MSNFKNKHTGSRNRPSSSFSHTNIEKLRSRRPKSQSRTYRELASSNKTTQLDIKFMKLQSLKSAVALEKAKLIIEIEVQNNKASISQVKKALYKGFNEIRKGNILLGNSYILLAFALLSTNWGDTPKPIGTKIGGPDAFPGLRNSGTADMS